MGQDRQNNWATTIWPICHQDGWFWINDNSQQEAPEEIRSSQISNHPVSITWLRWVSGTCTTSHTIHLRFHASTVHRYRLNPWPHLLSAKHRHHPWYLIKRHHPCSLIPMSCHQNQALHVNEQTGNYPPETIIHISNDPSTTTSVYLRLETTKMLYRSWLRDGNTNFAVDIFLGTGTSFFIRYQARKSGCEMLHCTQCKYLGQQTQLLEVFSFCFQLNWQPDRCKVCIIASVKFTLSFAAFEDFLQLHSYHFVMWWGISSMRLEINKLVKSCRNFVMWWGISSMRLEKNNFVKSCINLHNAIISFFIHNLV